MITARLFGRLGNNLFQIATTIALADKYGDIAEFERYSDTEEFSNHYTSPEDKLWYPDFGLPTRRHEIENYYEEIGHEFNEIPYSPNLCLKGFFQSEKYFANIREKLKTEIFKVPNKPLTNTIAVHVRKADFRLYPESFPMMPDEYYLNSLEILNFREKTVIIFSDEIETCRKIFANLNVLYSGNQNPLEDLYLMANCENHIISNSAFSWWGAWLSNSLNPKVVCPSKDKWYGQNTNINTNDLIPETWMQM